MAAQALLARAHGSVADGTVEDDGVGVVVGVVDAEVVPGAMHEQALDSRTDKGPTWLLTQAAEA